jgi:glycosyltransferase involved in cell wall biosynthesis
MQLSIITATYNRAELFKNSCLPSLLAQSNQNFEWIIINDGACSKTKEIIHQQQYDCSIVYLETSHQGLIKARNKGLSVASAPLISFLDDDNALNPTFVEDVLHFFEMNPSVKMCNPIRKQRRDIYKEGLRVKTGKEFFRPVLDATNTDFVQNNSKAWFDSNGFVHRKNDRVRFNPNTLIMSDYEYLLQCFSFWGLGSLAILPKELILYIQTNSGIIGQSNFKEWLKEFEFINQNQTSYDIFKTVSPEPWLTEEIEALKLKVKQNKKLPGF